mgnify:CR=1 FL=1
MVNTMYDYFLLKHGHEHVIEFTIKPNGKLVQENELTEWQQKTYDTIWKYQRSGTAFHAYETVLNEYGYVMYEALLYLPTLSHRWIRGAMLKIAQNNGDVKCYAVDITRIKNSPVFQLDMPNETIWWGPTKGKVGCKRRDLIILTHSIRGMPQKTIAETMFLTVKNVERVLKRIHNDLTNMFYSEESALEDFSKTLREMITQLDIMPFLMRKLDWFDPESEYLLVAPQDL